MQKVQVRADLELLSESRRADGGLGATPLSRTIVAGRSSVLRRGALGRAPRPCTGLQSLAGASSGLDAAGAACEAKARCRALVGSAERCAHRPSSRSAYAISRGLTAPRFPARPGGELGPSARFPGAPLAAAPPAHLPTPASDISGAATSTKEPRSTQQLRRFAAGILAPAVAGECTTGAYHPGVSSRPTGRSL